MSPSNLRKSEPPSSSSSKKDYSFICMSTTVDDLSYTPSEQEKSRDAAQFVATGRRSWKTLKGKGEAVWPPLLEASLLEALEKYQPESLGAKSDKTFGRFPLRNRFISDYIFETTGKRRTPKQVGSRLQQLRDTCKKEKILQLISRRSTSEPASTGPPSVTGSQSDVSPGGSPSPSPDSCLPRSTKPIHVSIVLQKELWPSITPSIDFVNKDATNPQSIQLAPLTSSLVGCSQDGTSVLPFLNAAVEFPSPYALMPQSTFIVYSNDSNLPLHMETPSLKCLSSPMDRSGWLYSSELVPGFWGRLCSSRDITQYTILQTLKPLLSQQLQSSGSSPRNVSIIYKFTNAPQAPKKNSNSTYPPMYLLSNEQLASIPPRANSNMFYTQWSPSQSDALEFNYSQGQEQGYHVDSSFGIISGNPVSSPYATPQQRCDGHCAPSRDVIPKYESEDISCQTFSGSYYPNYIPHNEFTHEAVYSQHQQQGYSNC